MTYSHKCPQCGKPVDPLRARAVALIDGNFLYFCSQSCRERMRAGREATQEITAAQIVDIAEPASKAELKRQKAAARDAAFAEHEAAQADAADQTQPSTDLATGDDGDSDSDSDIAESQPGRAWVRWAIAAVVLLLTAGGLVLFFLRTP